MSQNHILTKLILTGLVFIFLVGNTFADTPGLVPTDIHLETKEPSPILWCNEINKPIVQPPSNWVSNDLFSCLNGSDHEDITVMGNELSNARNPVNKGNNSFIFIDETRLLVYNKIDEKDHTINCDPQFIDDRNMRIDDPSMVLSKRIEVIKAIWGIENLPDRSNVVVTADIKSPLNPCPSLAFVDKIEVPVDAYDARETFPIFDLAYHFVPVERNNRLVLFNPGHLCTLKDNEDAENDHRVEATITGLLDNGFDVLAVYMPHVSDTSCNLDHCSIINTSLGPGEYPATYGLRFFLEPTIVSLNYLLKKINYENVNMVGLSGGGWTTNVLSAIDERIKYSFSIAGSMPLYYRFAGSVGDIEQYLPELYQDIAGYPDLYILGSFGKGRKQVQVLNVNDDCCFGQNQHEPGRDYLKDLYTFEKSVKDRLFTLGAQDHYYLVIDETAPNHQISADALNNVILKELK